MKREVTAEELARPMVPYQQARAQIIGAFEPLAATRVLLDGALGMVAARDVAAQIDVPGFASSAMDGYAIRSADAPGSVRLIDDVPAGTVGTVTVTTGTAAKIMTGAPIPDGADAVVPWEDTTVNGEVVEVRVSVRAGHHVRPLGEDIARGARVVAAGTPLRAGHLGVLASLGHTDVEVVPRPTVAILSTGDEVVAPGSALGPGQVYDANGTLLRALCREAGADVVEVSRLADEPDQISAWFADAAKRVDLIITTGGASVGEHDWVRHVLERDGDLTLWRIAIKPGKPVAFATIGSARVLGLPGNPGSAFTGMHVFVQPVLRRMGGRDPEPARVRARLATDVANKGRTLFCRVTLDAGVATPMPAQSSVVLSNVLDADGYAVIDPGGMAAGDEVTVELLR